MPARFRLSSVARTALKTLSVACAAATILIHFGDAASAATRLYVTNLDFKISEQELSDFFSRFGEVSKVDMPVDAATKRRKGVAFVTITDDNAAGAIISNTNGKRLGTKNISVSRPVESTAPAKKRL